MERHICLCPKLDLPIEQPLCLQQVVKLAVLLQSYGLDQAGTGLDVLQHVCEPAEVAAARGAARPTAMAGVLRLNARQRRTLRRAHERAVAAMNELSCNPEDPCRRRLVLEEGAGDSGDSAATGSWSAEPAEAASSSRHPAGGPSAGGPSSRAAGSLNARDLRRPTSARSTETVHYAC